MPDIILALGGGGMKGIAHVGVVRCLEAAGYTIRAVAGSSIGGLIGAVYAAGHTPDEIESIISGMERSRLFHHKSGEGPGLLGLGGVTSLLADVLGDQRFEDLKIPFACTAVDLTTAQEVVLSQGRVADSVLATIAVPGIFPPRELGGATLIDGAVLDPVPVALARWLMPTLPVVAVVLSPIPEGWRHLAPITKGILPATAPIPLPVSIIEQVSRLRITQAFTIFTRSIDITSLMLAELRLKIDQPDVIIRPDLHRFGLLDEVDPQEMILLGETATREALPQIQQALPWYRGLQRRLKPSAPPGIIMRDGMIFEDGEENEPHHA